MTRDELRQKAVEALRRGQNAPRWIVGSEDKRWLAATEQSLTADATLGSNALSAPVLDDVIVRHDRLPEALPMSMLDKVRAGKSISGNLAPWILAAVLGAGLLWSNKPEPKPPQPDSAAIMLPSELKLTAGELGDLTAETQGKLVRWDFPPGLQHRAGSEKHGVIVSAKVNGRYRVLAWTCYHGEPTSAAECIIVVGDSPLPPGPGPGPFPPGPGPEPSDPFYPTLKAVYNADGSASKDQDRRVLVALYRQAMTEIVRRPDITTAGKLVETVHGAVQVALADRLRTTRRVVADELNSKLPKTTDVPLDAMTREAYATQFQRMALLLEALK